MPVSNETLNRELYDILRSRNYDPVGLDTSGDPTDDTENADVFRFHMEDEETGEKITAWATIEGRYLVLYMDNKLAKHKDFESLSTFLRRWSQRKTLLFKTSNRDRLLGDMKKRAVMQKKEQVLEGYHAMGKKASYNDAIPQVKIVLQHTRQLEEGEQRFRNIAKIFVENTGGERFAIPTNRPGLARVYARHIAEGGTPYDDKGRHITSLCEEYQKMAGFVRATKNSQFNEDAQKLVNVGINHYQSLKETLTKMTTGRGYNKYFENWTPVLNEESDNDDTLNELFVRETLDPRIESVMPILSKLKKQIHEMDEVSSLAEWADEVINEKLDTETNESTRKHFKQVADVISQHPHPAKRKELAKHHADIFAKQNARFDKKKFFAAAKAEDDNEKPEEVKEEVKVKYEVRDKAGNRLGTWDGMDFKSYDITKHKHGKMIPKGTEVDKASGPMGKHDDDLVKAGIKETDLDEGSDVKYFYVKVDGKEKFKTKKSDEAKKMAEEMKKDPAFDGKDIEVVEKIDYQTQVGEDLDANQKRAGQLGPTEKVGPKGAVGKLVGASESIELDKLKALSGIK